MVKELAPLHEHVCVLVVLGDVGGGHQQRGDEAWAWQMETIVQLSTIPAFGQTGVKMIY